MQPLTLTSRSVDDLVGDLVEDARDVDAGVVEDDVERPQRSTVSSV
jgi:hypothetical protein